MVAAIPSSVVAALTTFAAVALGTASLVLVVEWWREQRRAGDVRRSFQELARQPEAGTPEQSLFRHSRSNVAWVQSLATALPQIRDLERYLEQAQIKWRVSSFLLLIAGAATAFGLATYAVTRNAWIAEGLAILGGSLPILVLRSRRARTFRQIEAQFPEAIELLARSIRAGHPLTGGIKTVAEEMPAPINLQFLRIFEEQRFGLPVDDSLLGLLDRVPLVDCRILVTAILIQREVGGNLAEILDSLAYTIRQRFRIRGQIRVYTAQGRLSGYVVGALPPIVGLIISLLNREYILMLFTDPVGRAMLASALMLQVLGFIWIRNIVNIEV